MIEISAWNALEEILSAGSYYEGFPARSHVFYSICDNPVYYIQAKSFIGERFPLKWPTIILHSIIPEAVWQFLPVAQAVGLILPSKAT